MIRVLVRVVCVVLLGVGAVLAAVPAGAQEEAPVVTVPAGGAPTSNGASGIDSPSLTLDQTTVVPGQRITVIFSGFSGRLVTLSVCGNLAKRGSGDCNMTSSQGVRLYHVDDSPLTAFVVSEPPGTCPCVIRASSEAGEVAYAPIEIEGVELGPVIDPYSDEPPLEVEVTAEPRPDGALGTLRSWLGGPTAYEVTVTVRNPVTETFSAVEVNGGVGRKPDVDLATFEMTPGSMGPGETWSGTAMVTVPAPVVGSFDWHVVASGAGPVSVASTAARTVPWLLLVLVLVLVGDLVALVVRAASKRRARQVADGDRAGRATDVGDQGPERRGDAPSSGNGAPGGGARSPVGAGTDR